VRNLLYLSGSEGIGAGIISDGHLLRGWLGLTGEVGHMPVEPEGLETVESSGRSDGRGASPVRPRPIHARPRPHYRPTANVTHFPLTNAIHL